MTATTAAATTSGRLIGWTRVRNGRDLLARLTSTTGGCSDSEVTALAVAPTGPASLQVATTVTPLGSSARTDRYARGRSSALMRAMLWDAGRIRGMVRKENVQAP